MYKYINYFLFLIILNEISFILFQMYYYELLCNDIVHSSTYNYNHYFSSFYSSLVCTFEQVIDYFFVDMVEVDYILDNFNNTFKQSYSGGFSIFCIYFKVGGVYPSSNDLFFDVLQQKCYVLPGELTLIFFRIGNFNDFSVNGITIYNVIPSFFNIYLIKLQCFCFEELHLNSQEILDLPVIFYLDKKIDSQSSLFLYVEYYFIHYG